MSTWRELYDKYKIQLENEKVLKQLIENGDDSQETLELLHECQSRQMVLHEMVFKAEYD